MMGVNPHACPSCAHYTTTATFILENGSYGNGGAMRVSPLAIAYRHADRDVLHQAVTSALQCTHTHTAGARNV
jgi:ADP-ribosylglycohydrolase